jgi:Tyrosine-protein kinase ephrin type A/B receptor-like
MKFLYILYTLTFILFQCQTVSSTEDICQPCHIGYYGDLSSDGYMIPVCVPCPINTYSDKIGASNASFCLPCSSNTYTLYTGSNSSKLCINSTKNSLVPYLFSSYGGVAFFNQDGSKIITQNLPPVNLPSYIELRLPHTVSQYPTAMTQMKNEAVPIVSVTAFAKTPTIYPSCELDIAYFIYPTIEISVHRPPTIMMGNEIIDCDTGLSSLNLLKGYL